MAAATGSEVLAAYKRGSVWGTAVACGANNAVLIKSERIAKRVPPMVDPSAGFAFERVADQGAVSVTGTLEAELRYDGWWDLLALWFGTAGAPAQQGGTAAYSGTLQLARNTDGKFCTLAFDKVTQIHEIPSGKIVGVTLSGRAGEAVTLSVETICRDRVAPAVVNSSTASWTFRERENRVLFSQGVFRCNAQSGAALASPADVIKPSGFTLAMRRNLEGDYLAEGTGKTLISEPVNNGLPEILLSLEFPQFASTTWVAALEADTRLKADITFTGKTIAGAYKRTLTLTFPHLMVEEEDAPIEGASKIPNPVRLRALEASAAPAGMSVTLPVTLGYTATQTTDPLA